MQLSKDESTEANQAYWRFVEETCLEFDKWPEWLKAGSQIVAVKIKIASLPVTAPMAPQAEIVHKRRSLKTRKRV